MTKTVDRNFMLVIIGLVALGIILPWLSFRVNVNVTRDRSQYRQDVETRLEWLEAEVMFLEHYHGCASDAGAPVRGELSTDD